VTLAAASTLSRTSATAALLLAATGCAAGSSPSPTAAVHTSIASQPTATPPATTPGRTTGMNIRLIINGATINATLNDSATARDFAAQLPLTLTLSDYHQTEKMIDLPDRLSTSGAPEGTTPQAGDLAYFAPWGNLAVYYRSAPYFSGVIKIGELDNAGIEQLSAADNGTVTIETAS